MWQPRFLAVFSFYSVFWSGTGFPSPSAKGTEFLLFLPGPVGSFYSGWGAFMSLPKKSAGSGNSKDGASNTPKRLSGFAGWDWFNEIPCSSLPTCLVSLGSRTGIRSRSDLGPYGGGKSISRHKLYHPPASPQKIRSPSVDFTHTTHHRENPRPDGRCLHKEFAHSH